MYWSVRLENIDYLITLKVTLVNDLQIISLPTILLQSIFTLWEGDGEERGVLIRAGHLFDIMA